MRLPGKGMSWKQFLLALKDKYTIDNVGDAAGNLTFSGILALFPFLLFLVALAGLIIGPQQLEQVVESLSKVAPPAVTQILGERLKAIVEGPHASLLTVGALGSLFSASGGVGALQRALNTVYDVKEERPFWKSRGVALLMTLVCAALGLCAALLAVGMGPVADAVGGVLGTAIMILRWPAAGLLMMLVWALLYWALPDVEQRFKFITPGSVVGVALWVAASIGFSIYVTHFGSYEATYGALGGVIVMLMWMWISSQVVLIGAEINAVIEHKSEEGKRPGAKSMQDTGTAPTPEGARMEQAKRAAVPDKKDEATVQRTAPQGTLDDGAPSPKRRRRRTGKIPIAGVAMLAGLAMLRTRRRPGGRAGRLH